MDLDKIKESWKNADIRQETDEKKIYRILTCKRNTSLQKLIRYERIGVFILPFFLFLPFVHNYFLPHTPYPVYSVALFIGFCAAAFFWQLFKISLLKKIDLGRMDIIASSKVITRYKKCIKYELLVALCWIIVFLASYFVSIIYKFPLNNLVPFFILCGILVALTTLVAMLSYNLFYSKHINKVQDAINEIREFEKQED